MARIKEIKISIHRKYTKDFQSYGYRIGLQMEVDKDDPRGGYYEGKAFLNERISEEDLIIKNIMDKKVAEKESGYKELSSVPEVKKMSVVSHACEGCGKWITGEKDNDGKLFCKNCGKKIFPYATRVSLVAGGVAEKKLVEIPMSGGVDGDVVMVPFDVKQIKRTSAKAVLVELFGTKGDLWIPKSCVGDGDAMELMQKGVKTQLFVASWFLIKSGLL